VKRLPPGTPLAERLEFWSEPDDRGCWRWQASKLPTGYGRISIAGGRPRVQAAHRVAYEVFVGPIPDGLEIDHLCRVRDCINPQHLEPVTFLENQRRRRSEVCRRGHPLSGDNLLVDRFSTRRCATCHRYWAHYGKNDGTEPVRKLRWKALHLTPEVIAAIRAGCRPGLRGHTQVDYANRYGVSRTTIQAILAGTGRWGDDAVTPPDSMTA
jgi:hypothetical protein